MLFMWKLALAFHIEDPMRIFCQIHEEEKVVYKEVMADYINYANRFVIILLLNRLFFFSFLNIFFLLGG